MNYDKFIEPKVVEVGGGAEKRTFVISQIPAVESFEIHNVVSEAIITRGVLGVTVLPIAVKKRLMSFVAYRTGDANIVLDSDQILSDVFKGKNRRDFEELVILVIKENFDFLLDGALLGTLEGVEKAAGSAS